jgi:hypothetical protein
MANPFVHALVMMFLYHLQEGGVSHWALAICIKKYLEGKEELWKLSQIFHHAKI